MLGFFVVEVPYFYMTYADAISLDPQNPLI